MQLSFSVLRENYTIYRLPAKAPLPGQPPGGDFFSVTGSPDELSVICNSAVMPPEGSLKHETGWRILKINGTLDFSLLGIIARVAEIMKTAEIPLCVISTFDTDYFLVKEGHLQKAVAALKASGYSVSN